MRKIECPFNSADAMAGYVMAAKSLILKRLESHDVTTGNIRTKIRDAKNNSEMIRKMQKRIKSIEELMEEYATFEARYLIYFLTHVLTIIEGKRYEGLEILDNNQAMISTKYTVITTAKDAKLIDYYSDKKGIEIDKKNINIFCPNSRYLLLPEEVSYSLLKGIELNPMFELFPYLKDIAYELINIKIKYPQISNLDAMKIFLEELRSAYGIKSKKVNER